MTDRLTDEQLQKDAAEFVARDLDVLAKQPGALLALAREKDRLERELARLRARVHACTGCDCPVRDCNKLGPGKKCCPDCAHIGLPRCPHCHGSGSVTTRYGETERGGISIGPCKECNGSGIVGGIVIVTNG